MPLITCTDCGKQHSDAAPACPNCGRPNSPAAAGADRPQVVQVQRQKSALGIGCTVLLGFVLVVLVISAVLALFIKPDLPPTDGIAYEVLDEWSIPAGGRGRVILIDPAFNDTGPMRALAEQLRREHQRDRVVNIEIFDDRRAAELRSAVAENEAAVRPDDLRHHDLHKIGFYQKNANTGHHQFIDARGGVDGEWTTIDFR